jgi:hypothetical protein
MKNRTSKLGCGMNALFKSVILIICVVMLCVGCAFTPGGGSDEEYEAANALPGDGYIFEDGDLDHEAEQARQEALKCQQEIDQLEAEITIDMVESMASVFKSRESKDPEAREKAAKDVDEMNSVACLQTMRKARVTAERDSWIRKLDRISEMKDKKRSGGGNGGGGC